MAVVVKKAVAPRSALATNLSKFGFKRAEDMETKHRLIMSLEGEEKQGKTHFAMTAPGPIVYISTDIGTEGVADKFRSDKEIIVLEVKVDFKRGDDRALIAKHADEVWKNFLAGYKAALDAKARTVVFDTATELWEIHRLARFGKLDQIKPHHYGPVNAEHQDLYRWAYEAESNLIALHKVKDEWLEKPDGKGGLVGYRTGEKKRTGFNSIGYLVQLNAICWRDMEAGKDASEQFKITVRDCRQNAEIAGETFEGPLCNFPFVATSVFPETDPEYWGA